MPYKNKEDQAKASHQHYLKNKEVMKKRAVIFKRKSYKRNVEYLKDYLSIHPCIDCGNTDIRVLDFDHVYGKKYKEVTTLARNGASLKKISAEIAKCEIRCANCHRIRHYQK